jgi:hypothetical protein
VVSDVKSDTVALYAEQPYTTRAGVDPTPPRWVAEAVGARTFRPVGTGARDRRSKWRAIRAYRSQLPLLGMTRDPRRGPLRLALRDERVAWPRE